MRVLQVYNRYRVKGHGEDFAVKRTLSLLKSFGIETELLEADSTGAIRDTATKIRTAISSWYSLRAKRSASRTIRRFRPDVLHAHNLYPVLTPSVLAAAHQAGVATVLTAHNYFLSCPVYTHLRRETICERCTTGTALHALVANCRQNWIESAVYSLRTVIARRFDLFSRHTTTLIALSAFARHRFVAAGFPADRIVVLANAVPVHDDVARPSHGRYVAYAGRLTRSKGLDLLRTAAVSTGLPIHVAGDVEALEVPRDTFPPNVRFVGHLSGPDLADFYAGARLLIFPSRWFEMCPYVVLEAMSYGLPVLAANIGSVPEIVQPDRNGWLFEAGNATDLARQMQHAWSMPEMCDRLGAAARARIASEFDEARYTQRLLDVYAEAIELSRGATRALRSASQGAR